MVKPTISRRHFVSLAGLFAAQHVLPIPASHAAPGQAVSLPQVASLPSAHLAGFMSVEVDTMYGAEYFQYRAAMLANPTISPASRHMITTLDRFHAGEIGFYESEHQLGLYQKMPASEHSANELGKVDQILKIVFGSNLPEKLSFLHLEKPILTYGEDSIAIALALTHHYSRHHTDRYHYEAHFSPADLESWQQVYYVAHEKGGQVHISLAGRESAAPVAAITDFDRRIAYADVATQLALLLKDHMALNAKAPTRSRLDPALGAAKSSPSPEGSI